MNNEGGVLGFMCPAFCIACPSLWTLISIYNSILDITLVPQNLGAKRRIICGNIPVSVVFVCLLVIGGD